LTVIILTLLGAVLSGSVVFCILTMVAVRNYLKIPAPRVVIAEPVSICKPLFGADDGLEENLRSFFQQDYPAFELLLAVNREEDNGTKIARKLMAEFPHVAAQLVVTGESPRPNGKVFSLQQMLLHAKYDILVMADSDIRVTHEMTRAGDLSVSRHSGRQFLEPSGSHRDEHRVSGRGVGGAATQWHGFRSGVHAGGTAQCAARHWRAGGFGRLLG